MYILLTTFRQMGLMSLNVSEQIRYLVLFLPDLRRSALMNLFSSAITFLSNFTFSIAQAAGPRIRNTTY
jgi:hypothetical protein